jgi:6-pyruvoyltetrahydropterin/6-carboxytetrahydropterin synthase
MLHEVSLVRRTYFSAGHKYESPVLSKDENIATFGACYSEYGHGHNYILEAEVSGLLDQKTGMVMNLRDLDIILKKITTPLDHHFLNTDVEFFKTHVPTTENVAIYCFNELNELLPQGTTLRRVRVYESDDLWAEVVN